MSTEFRKVINGRLTSLLKPIGFNKKGNGYTHQQNDITYYIETQGSRHSTSDNLVVTVNIGLTSSQIFSLWDISLPEAKQRHWEKRIGTFTSPRNDKWWEIKTEAEALNAAGEITAILELKVLPEILAIRSTQDLEDLWKQGKSPGITDKLRLEFLQLLQAQK